MYHINLIFTRHQACGNCNFYELYKIIDRVKPEIIFEELSGANFHRSYAEERLTTLETDAIKMYLGSFTARHLPVDTFNRTRSYEEDLDYMLDRITTSKKIDDSWTLCNLIKEQLNLAGKFGFGFLNSRFNDEVYARFDMLKKNILDQLGEERLFQINKLDREVIDKREDEMLANIYRYSKEHQYHRGLFFIGSGHRRSILRKIEKLNQTEQPKLNWSIWDSTPLIVQA